MEGPKFLKGKDDMQSDPEVLSAINRKEKQKLREQRPDLANKIQ